IDETDDVDGPRRLDFYFGDLIRFDNRVAIGLVLITFGDLVVADDLTALLTALVITYGAEVVTVKLIELNSLRGFDCVIDANRYRNQQETDVAFPNRSHRDPPKTQTRAIARISANLLARV